MKNEINKTENGILNLDLTKDIRNPMEFKTILMIIPMIDIGNIQDSLAEKVHKFIGEHAGSPEEAELMALDFMKARNASFDRLSDHEKFWDGTRNRKLSFQSHGNLQTWSTSWSS